MSKRLKELAQLYAQLGHAVQSGIAMLMELPGQTFTTPKHLRVGIDTSKSDMRGLVTLLINKGVITEEEYYEAMTDAMSREVVEYEHRLSRELGVSVTLK